LTDETKMETGYVCRYIATYEHSLKFEKNTHGKNLSVRKIKKKMQNRKLSRTWESGWSIKNCV